MAPRPSRFSLSSVFSLCWSIWKQWSENSLSGSLCTRLWTTAVPQLSFWTLSVMSEENGRLLTNKDLIASLTHRKAHFIKTQCEQKKYPPTQPWFVFPHHFWCEINVMRVRCEYIPALHFVFTRCWCLTLSRSGCHVFLSSCKSPPNCLPWSVPEALFSPSLGHWEKS